MIDKRKTDNIDAIFKITTLFTLLDKGCEILTISVNREIAANSSNVKGKIKSMKEYGVANPLNLIPAHFAREEGLELVDHYMTPVTDEARINNAYVIMDGNNRYKAYLEILKQKEKAEAKGKEYDEGKGLDDIPCIIRNKRPEMGVLNTLIAMNVEVVAWKGFDYAKSAAKLNPENKVLSFVKMLVTAKMNINTISLLLTFGSELKANVYATAIKTGKFEPKDVNLDRAQKIYQALKDAGFEQKIINKRYLIQYIIKKGDKLDEVLDAFKSLSEDQVRCISDNLGTDPDALAVVDDLLD